MSNSENGNQQGRKAELPGQQLTAEQMRRFQSDIEGQGQRVAHFIEGKCIVQMSAKPRENLVLATLDIRSKNEGHGRL
jgi:lipopolysaccharide export system protein LptA